MAGHSQRLRLSDVNVIHRIVREACELGDDPRQWREHVIRRMQPLLGWAVAASQVSPIPFDPRTFRPLVFISLDPDPHWTRYLSNADLSPDPHTVAIVPRLASGFHETTEQLCGRRAWHRSEFFNEVMRPCRYDDNLVSVVGLPQSGCASVIGFARRVGDKPFGERQRRIVRLLHEEIAELWRKPALAVRAPWWQRLTPRLRDVLQCLLEGLSEKQAALRLGLRRTTVHNHIERLHRALDVSSRGELLAKARPRPSYRPKLVPDAASSTGAADGVA